MSLETWAGQGEGHGGLAVVVPDVPPVDLAKSTEAES